MSENRKLDKQDLARFIVSAALADSADDKVARQYLTELGHDPDELTEILMKNVRKIQTKTLAETKKNEMSVFQSYFIVASAKARELLSDPNFDFFDFIKEKNVALNYRNLEDISTEQQLEVVTRFIQSELGDANDVR